MEEKLQKERITKLAIACFVFAVVIPIISFLIGVMFYPKTPPDIESPFHWFIYSIITAGMRFSPYLSLLFGVLAIIAMMKSKEASIKNNLKEVILLIIGLLIPILMLVYSLKTYLVN